MSQVSDRVNIILSLKNRMSAGLRQASAKLNQFAVRTREAGQAMAIGAAIMGAGIWKTTQLAVGLDDAMRMTQARIANVTNEQMADLRTMVKELGRTTSFTTGEVAGLVAELARGGKKAHEIQALTKPMLDLARATGITSSEAAAFTQQALASFKLGVGEAAHVADVLTYAANNSFQGVEDLGEALKFAGPIAEQTGQSFEQVIASMSMMANVGIKGTMAGRQLRKVLVDLTNNGSKAAEKLGVAIEGADGKVRALPLILGDFIEATKDMSQLEKLSQFNDAFGKIGLNASLIGGESAKKIMSLSRGLKNLNGTAKDTAATMDGGIGGTLRRLWSAVEGVVLALGESMVPVIDKMAQGFTILSNVLTPILEKVSWLGPTLIALFTALAAGGVTLLVVAGIATILSAGFAAVGGAISAVSAIIGFFGAGAVASFAAVGVPLGIFLAAIAAIAVALVDWGAVWKEVSEFSIETWNLLSKTASDSLDGMVNAFAKGDLQLGFDIMMKGLEVSFFGTMDNLFGGWRDTLNFMVGFLSSILVQINIAWSAMIGLIGRAIIGVQYMLGLISDETKSSMMEINDIMTKQKMDAGNDSILAAGKSLTDLFNKTGDQRQAELDALIAKAKKVQQEAIDIQGIFEDMMRGVRDFADSITDEITAMTDKAARLFEKGVKAAQGFNVSQKITRGAVGAFSTTGLQSKLAENEKDIMSQQLVEHKTTNTLLLEISDKFGSFWGT